MRSGPTPGKIYPLSKSELYIGRDVANDIVITDAEISRKHARLLLQGTGYVLEDLGSTNGCFVNGQRLLGPHVLQPGELVMLGENIGLVYEATGYDPNATVISGAPATTPPTYEPRPTPAYTPPPPQAQAYPPPPQVQAYPPPPPAYAQPEPPPRRGGCGRWLLAGCGCLVIVLCLVVVGTVVAYMAAPTAVEEFVCQQPLRPITDAILSLLEPIFGAPYYCP
jgi:hypothetical protein